jgi:inositol oxygenase
LQTAEAIRADGHPDWMVLTGLIHDLGKVLLPVRRTAMGSGGRYVPDRMPVFFEDRVQRILRLESRLSASGVPDRSGIYAANCGLSNVHLSWGHDEYLYHLLKDYLPEPAQYMIRYHSFYAWHREGEYGYLQDDTDRAMLPWVKKFNPYDLYSKSPEPPRLAELKPYYEDLLARYLPATLTF